MVTAAPQPGRTLHRGCQRQGSGSRWCDEPSDDGLGTDASSQMSTNRGRGRSGAMSHGDTQPGRTLHRGCQRHGSGVAMARWAIGTAESARTLHRGCQRADSGVEVARWATETRSRDGRFIADVNVTAAGLRWRDGPSGQRSRHERFIADVNVQIPELRWRDGPSGRELDTNASSQMSTC